MVINRNSPEQILSFSFVVSFLGFAIFIYLWKPLCVCVGTHGYYVVSKKLLICFSLILAIITTIIVLLAVTKNTTIETVYGKSS